ncbi:hypothetical protein ACGFNU_30455 [Spirillospora sp. NPDC048911]|uniref:hypothetical protein n=1 Tax=Spirillospora sp. NPDC048911 TaxID=3364527 RepID=UPI00371955AF
MNAAAPTAPASLGLGIGPDGTYTRGAQVVAFLLGLWTMIAFFPLLFPGAILYAKSEETFEANPGRARTMVLWSWLCVSVLPLIPVAIGTGVVIAFNSR